jgi:hypothetical protein
MSEYRDKLDRDYTKTHAEDDEPKMLSRQLSAQPGRQPSSLSISLRIHFAMALFTGFCSSTGEVYHAVQA